ncbi:hypothetical protein J5N97_005855 [Dioscorea zingiberensis]|uniref:Protein LURP-one-related 6 n=1 Tax=Dioscorea zingiberensis TaxID=325984 RepID=A0A9D5HSU5_9LILI|nr:hypothetical protein J5N97_005855 [Dioscorea zingiberensis]
MGGSTILKPIVSKTFCSSSETMFMVRKRPNVINGGGFVVMNLGQKVVFSVDGCGILGAKGELIVRDGDGASTLFIRKKGGIVQALSFEKRWKGYLMDQYEGTPSKLVFSLREPIRSCIAVNTAIKVSIAVPKEHKDWDYEVRGSFMDKSCTINDRRGDVVAEVGVGLMKSKELYYVLVKAGYDRAFVVGIIAILDNIHGESTRC